MPFQGALLGGIVTQGVALSLALVGPSGRVVCGRYYIGGGYYLAGCGCSPLTGRLADMKWPLHNSECLCDEAHRMVLQNPRSPQNIQSHACYAKYLRYDTPLITQDMLLSAEKTNIRHEKLRTDHTYRYKKSQDLRITRQSWVLNMKKKLRISFIERLNIESEVHNIAILNDVFLAFNAHKTSLLNGSL